MAQSFMEKLQLKPGQKMAVLSSPAEVMDYLQANLPELALTTTTTVKTDAVLFFVTTQSEVEALLPHAAATLIPGGLLWIAYPKGGSNMLTDLNRDRLAAALQSAGWQPVRQVALDNTWSAMRFKPAAQPAA